MGFHPVTDAIVRPAPSVSSEPAHLSFLLGTVRVSLPQRLPPRQVKWGIRQNPVTPRPRRPEHKLSESQRLAMSWFHENGESLEPDFTEGELKKAYRRLALRFHPDRPGGTPHRFRTLLGHERDLRRALGAPSTSGQ